VIDVMTEILRVNRCKAYIFQQISVRSNGNSIIAVDSWILANDNGFCRVLDPSGDASESVELANGGGNLMSITKRLALRTNNRKLTQQIHENSSKSRN